MEKAFNRLATVVSHAAGRPWAFVLCLSAVLTWAITGAIFHYSETWQLIINTGTTIVTFLMVFLIQNTQNRDSAAIQAKLDELIRASEGKNEFIGVENLSESEGESFRKQCQVAKERMAAIDAGRASGKVTILSRE
ncbi:MULTISPECIES: low affinity iron permease family protein [unclassified Mesorhizobium]|jgi:low affinity Fe/Cu permease|uniref:low affinity iron permease family protein n=1 Tax=unclassified Mesorhizobium TaxID=325217 RepID=UPI00086C08D4|nr:MULTISPECIES: low affinity iron permease family protein [unclassified Mesorhizobium]MBN9255063.1 low affinity iron permease family protein [Mesorhizobium sp.]MBN9269492.1 low affinity iron permease family protein [Mesorhizobium sp.]ODT29860.1 MAG: iron permease [Kaistia sp. SCN 65-12]OJX76037.1 MAG: iron permease [Mesorhizobium sp. 65-26]